MSEISVITGKKINKYIFHSLYKNYKICIKSFLYTSDMITFTITVISRNKQFIILTQTK